MKTFTPAVGDIVWRQFTPSAKQEQAICRPALVLTTQRNNAMRGMMLCCPMGTKVKSYVFEVRIEISPPCVACVDQVKSLDRRARQARRSGKASAEAIAEARAKLRALLSL